MLNKKIVKIAKFRHFGQKTHHFGKITEFDENHVFRDFHVSVPNY